MALYDKNRQTIQNLTLEHVTPPNIFIEGNSKGEREGSLSRPQAACPTFNSSRLIAHDKLFMRTSFSRETTPHQDTFCKYEGNTCVVRMNVRATRKLTRATPTVGGARTRSETQSSTEKEKTVQEGRKTKTRLSPASCSQIPWCVVKAADIRAGRG